MKISKILTEYFQIALGIVLAGIGLKAFLLPNGFLDGGVTGIAILLSNQFNWNVSLLLVGLSLPFIVLAYYALSWRIVIKALISIIGLAVFIQFENFGTLTDDKLLISIFGGLFVGMGIGITIRNGAVLDGSEILGIVLNDRLGLSIGRVILLFNIILFSITAVIVSVEVAMYSILTYVVTAKVTDFVIEGFEDFIGVTIVSKQYEAVKQAIIEEVGAGMTLYNGRGGYSAPADNDFEIIHTIINRIDIRKMYKVVEDVDPDAFIVEYHINNIKGGVLRRYLQRKKGQQAPVVPG